MVDMELSKQLTMLIPSSGSSSREFCRKMRDIASRIPWADHGLVGGLLHMHDDPETVVNILRLHEGSARRGRNSTSRGRPRGLRSFGRRGRGRIGSRGSRPYISPTRQERSPTPPRRDRSPTPPRRYRSPTPPRRDRSPTLSRNERSRTLSRRHRTSPRDSSHSPTPPPSRTPTPPPRPTPPPQEPSTLQQPPSPPHHLLRPTPQQSPTLQQQLIIPQLQLPQPQLPRLLQNTAYRQYFTQPTPLQYQRFVQQPPPPLNPIRNQVPLCHVPHPQPSRPSFFHTPHQITINPYLLPSHPPQHQYTPRTPYLMPRQEPPSQPRQEPAPPGV